jgi:hypothetical protein
VPLSFVATSSISTGVHSVIVQAATGTFTLNRVAVAQN